MTMGTVLRGTTQKQSSGIDWQHYKELQLHNVILA